MATTDKKQSTALAEMTHAPASALAHSQVTPGMAFTMATFDEVWRFAQVISKSGMTPKGIDTAEQVTVQIMMGNDLGLKPMVSVQNIIVINGKPSIPGDLALSIVMSSGLLEDYDEEIVGEGDDRIAIATIKRKNMREIKRKFSVKDAIQAGLWQTEPTVVKSYWDKVKKERVTLRDRVPNESPWFRYQERMLIMRARGFGLRDRFPDVLKGMHLTEEMHGVEEEHRDPVPVISGPVAPDEEIEDADIVEHNTTLAAHQAKPAADVTVATKEQPKNEAATGAAPAGPDAPDDDDVTARFDEEEWMLDVRVRFGEAKTPEDVDAVHRMFEDTVDTIVGMEGRQTYEGYHTDAMERVSRKPAATNQSATSGEDTPFDEHIKPQEPDASPEGVAFLIRFRKTLNTDVTTRDGVTAFWNAQGQEFAALIADGDLAKEWDAVLRAEATARFKALPKPAAVEKPAEEDKDGSIAFDREFRAKVESIGTVKELNDYSTDTLPARNGFGSGHPLYNEWRSIVTHRRNVLNGIA